MAAVVVIINGVSWDNAFHVHSSIGAATPCMAHCIVDLSERYGLESSCIDVGCSWLCEFEGRSEVCVYMRLGVF